MKLKGCFHFHCRILGFLLTPIPWRIMPFFKRLRKTLPDHSSGLRTEVSEQNSPPPNLDHSVCFILPLHDNDTNIKREQKRSSSSKNVEELNDIKIVKRDKTDHSSTLPPPPPSRKYDNYFSRLKMLTSFYNSKGDDKIHIFNNDNNTYMCVYI